MANKIHKFICIKDLIMSDGKIGFIKGNTYRGILRPSGSGRLKSELTVGMIHSMKKENMEEYLYEFKYGK